MAFFSGVTDDTIDVGGKKIRYYDSAPDRRGDSTIVLLHGTGGSAQGNFWALFPMLAARHRVVTFDFVDSDSDDAERGHYAVQAQGVIKALCDGPVDLAGCSLGAVIAAQVAGTTPELVRSLVLIAGWIKTDLQQLLRYDVWQTLYEENSAALPAFMAMTAFSHPYLIARTPEEIAGLVDGLSKGPDRGRKMLFNRSIDISDEVSRVTAPTLIIGCTHDQMVPIYHSRMLFGGIENARFAEVSAGHAVTHERPAQLMVLMQDFIAEPEAHQPGTIHAPIHA